MELTIKEKGQEGESCTKHNKQISIAKGIGIILVVIGHSGCPEYLHTFIYSFHMALFYFCSALFYDERKIFNKPRDFVFRKIKGLYWPYVKWSVIFILLHNLFYSIGFNNNHLSYTEMYINIKCSIRCLWQGERFLGAYWFLPSLLGEIIIFSLIVWMTKYVKNNKMTLILVLIGFCLGLLANQLKIDLIANRELVMLPIYYSGFWIGKKMCNKCFLQTFLSMKLFVISLVCLLIIPFLNSSMSVAQNNFEVIPFTYLTFVSGILFILYISKILMNYEVIGKLLDYIGTKTLSILTFHYLGFKLMTLLLVYVFGSPKTMLGDWPIPDELKKYWVIYTIIGVSFSLLLSSLRINRFRFKRN